MGNNKEKIDVIYNKLIQNNGVLTEEHNVNGIAREYEDLMETERKKASGSFYTPKFIIKYMVDKALSQYDLSKNPYIKILDPSCGSGYFLDEIYNRLRCIYKDNLDIINEKNPELNLKKNTIHEHIINNNIFAADADEYGVKLSVINLIMKSPKSLAVPKIICCDSLLNWEDTFLEHRDFWSNKFDLIIGNPPYIGHKKMGGKYRKLLNGIYEDIFKDKADISFCFIKSSIDRLNEKGVLNFITSRYFMESPSGFSLRNFLKENTELNEIIDFYGVRIIKGISVDPVIIEIIKEKSTQSNKINVAKAKPQLKKLDGELIFTAINIKDARYYDFFTVNQHTLLDSGWSLINDESASIIEKIQSQLKCNLSEACISFQGIITGCDKAFIVDKNIINKFNIEKALLKRWIKNSNIKKYVTDNNSKYLIYANDIKNVEEFKGAISHIEQYKDKLMQRRECKNGVRKWYELQWGREAKRFDGKKIIFPYKSSNNRFALDEGSYSSADIYGIIIKDEFKDKISYEFLLGLLNSKLYEFYFKSYAKKLGENLYDYYPNTVMRLKIPCLANCDIEELVNKIIYSKDEGALNTYIRRIDELVYDYFKLTDGEIALIEKSTN
ncbi:modification methylase PaeR7I [Oxobacter pfennigii]|uniref:site-specific DNA-methyltransferase (adenine-specific) n=1 Tax=Oxobacter pfennigii TaxID=36849 RepID=A0A0N8NTN8_9CLOT|nr:N-6 DNA methylase [Oxobacter pfennigii]KPU45352.1 modification methylase PaeR7I [Oxobacter pfennigii]